MGDGGSRRGAGEQRRTRLLIYGMVVVTTETGSLGFSTKYVQKRGLSSRNERRRLDGPCCAIDRRDDDRWNKERTDGR